MYADQEGGNEQFDVRAYLKILRRWWWLAVISLVVSLGASGLLTIRATRIYEAQTRLFVGQQAISRQDLQFAAGLTQTSLALVKSYSEAIKSRPIAEKVIRELDLNQTPEHLMSSVTAAPIGETQIIQLTYKDPDPLTAERVANSWAESFTAAIGRIDRSSEGGPAVQVAVLEPAVLPQAPVSPKPLRNGLAGLLLGGILAVGAMLLAERLDASVQGREDIERVTQVPVLTLVPAVKVPAGELVHGRGTPAGEAYKMLRTAVGFLGADRPLQVVAVTSPESGDGKTTTAFNLAAAFAEAGVTCAYVEADMRRPNIARHLLLPVRTGLSSFLGGNTKPTSFIHQTTSKYLYVIPAGQTPPNPAELLGSVRMKNFVDHLRGAVQMVIVDTPPVLAVSDAAALSKMVDGVMLVVRAGKTSRDHLKEAMRVLGGVGAPVAGIVLNAVTEAQGYSYGYYAYGYGYGTSTEAATLRESIEPLRPIRGAGAAGAGDHESGLPGGIQR